MMYDTNEIGKKLKELRNERANLYNENPDNENFKKYACCQTQESLSEAMGKERRTIGNWERGDTCPDIESLVKLCDILNCSIEYFLGVTNISEIDPIVMASHHTGISSEIIKCCMQDAHYLDFLNFFMKPENCRELLEGFNITAQCEYFINKELSDSNIKERTIDVLKDYFEEFCCFTPSDKNCLEQYKKYIKNKLSKRTNGQRINIKSYITPKIYDKLLSVENFDEKYDNFINYLAEQTYEPFRRNVIIRFQKEKMKKYFISVFERFVSELIE